MKISLRFQILLAIFLAPVLMAASFIYEHQSSVFRIRQYVGIWEDDVAESLVIKKDPQLLEKVRSQLSLVVSAVQNTEVIGAGDEKAIQDSDFQNSIVVVPLSLNLNPVGQVVVTLSNHQILLSSLASPIFVLGILLFMGMSLLFARREFSLRMERVQLDQKLKMEKEFSSLALQVAHDIRSPLMAVTTVVGRPGAVHPEVLPLLESASDRIKVIAEDLLSRGRSYKMQDVPISVDVKASESQVSEVVKSIDALVKEFNLKYPQRAWGWKNSATELEAKVPLKIEKIERMVSNLFQNAEESFEISEGRIQVDIFTRGEKLQLRVQDSGKGMSEEVLQTVLNQGGSFGKKNGNGLGIGNIREELKAISGQLSIQSREGVGTIVSIEIPLILP